MYIAYNENKLSSKYHKKAQVKKHIQYTFHQALEHRMIQDNCQIKFKNKKRKHNILKYEILLPYLLDKVKQYIFMKNYFKKLDKAVKISN